MSQKRNAQTPKSRARMFVSNDRTNLRISPELAMEIGFNESIVLLQLEYLISISTTEERDGSLWTYVALSDLKKSCFPFWGITTISRVMRSLRSKRLIKIGNYNKLGFDRTTWYAIDPEGFKGLKSVKLDTSIFQNEKCNTPNCKMDVIKMENPLDQIDQMDSINLEHPFDQDGTTIPKTSSKTSSKTSTKTSSSCDDDFDFDFEDYEDYEDREEEVTQTGLSTNVVNELKRIGVFENLLPEIEKKGLPEKTVLELIKAAKTREPEPPNTAALFIYRLRNYVAPPINTEPARSKYSGGEYADLIQH